MKRDSCSIKNVQPWAVAWVGEGDMQLSVSMWCLNTRAGEAELGSLWGARGRRLVVYCWINRAIMLCAPRGVGSVASSNAALYHQTRLAACVMFVLCAAPGLLRTCCSQQLWLPSLAALCPTTHTLTQLRCVGVCVTQHGASCAFLSHSALLFHL